MQEAKYSINARFTMKGFDSQVTLRTDEKLNDLVGEYLSVLKRLQEIGANSDKPVPIPSDETPTCKECSYSDQMKLVTFIKEGVTKSIWKCQRCNKWWYPDKKEASKSSDN